MIPLMFTAALKSIWIQPRGGFVTRKKVIHSRYVKVLISWFELALILFIFGCWNIIKRGCKSRIMRFFTLQNHFHCISTLLWRVMHIIMMSYHNICLACKERFLINQELKRLSYFCMKYYSYIPLQIWKRERRLFTTPTTTPGFLKIFSTLFTACLQHFLDL